MFMKASDAAEWRQAKARLLLPIVYVRGFAMTGGEIEDTTADPFNGFNVGSTQIRTGWTGDTARHIFESPVLRLTQPPYGYRLAFSNGLAGLDPEVMQALAEQDGGAGVLAIYRYYDIDSKMFGSGRRAGMEVYGFGLGRLVLDLLAATGAPGVYLVAHSMGGLVARTFLQNEAVLDDTNPRLGNEQKAMLAALADGVPPRRISQAEWGRARAAVRRLFTYGTPHKGISVRGGRGNWLLGPLDTMLGLELANFDEDRIREYLDGPPVANSLAGRFPVEHAFTLVGTGAADYPVAHGMSARLIGAISDGLVELDNAVVGGPRPGGDPNKPEDMVLAARAYVRRAHSGPFGMVNSEEGFGNLSRFLFGDLRVDATLEVRRIDLPAELQARKDEVRASYSFESFLRVRGERWAMTERQARDGAAIFRRYDELISHATVTDPRLLTDERKRETAWHARVDLFSAFLDSQLRVMKPGPDRAGGLDIGKALGFALRLRVAVPNYELAGRLWGTNHYEGSALLDRDIVFLAFPAETPGGWSLAWGPNLADGTNAGLSVITDALPDDAVPEAGIGYVRALDGALEFWVPLHEPGPPVFSAWIRLVARRWNDEAAPAGG